MRWILVVGSMREGFKFYGPYSTKGEADAVGNTFNSTGACWSVERLYGR